MQEMEDERKPGAVCFGGWKIFVAVCIEGRRDEGPPKRRKMFPEFQA